MFENIYKQKKVLFKMTDYYQILEQNFDQVVKTPSDINEHIVTLYKYAKECDTIIELGVRTVVSSWAFLKGLVDNKSTSPKRLICSNLIFSSNLGLLQKVAKNLGVEFQFIIGNLLEQTFPASDLVFIDTWHVYAQLKRELNFFKSKAQKYIIMHDTTIDAVHGETIRNGWDPVKQSEESGYPVEEIVIGLMPAINEFLVKSSDFKIRQKFEHNNGLTILQRQRSGNKKKLLILIIASDNQKVYQEYQKVWRAYMHEYPEIESYFIKSDPQLQTKYKVEKDVIWIKQKESYIPGVLYKTLGSLEFFQAKLGFSLENPQERNFDYVLRTNLSSFYDLPKLLLRLEKLPKKKCYAAVKGESDGIIYGSGSGFILSTDVIKFLIDNQKKIKDNYQDDIAIGDILYDTFGLIELSRLNAVSIKNFAQNDEKIKDHFHFRLKICSVENESKLRLHRERYLAQELLYKIYNKFIDF
mgnify:CR=1 FL=1